jgi:hypothetical protein
LCAECIANLGLFWAASGFVSVCISDMCAACIAHLGLFEQLVTCCESRVPGAGWRNILCDEARVFPAKVLQCSLFMQGVQQEKWMYIEVWLAMCEICWRLSLLELYGFPEGRIQKRRNFACITSSLICAEVEMAKITSVKVVWTEDAQADSKEGWYWSGCFTKHEDVNWFQVALNRSQWNFLVTTVMNVQAQ